MQEDDLQQVLWQQASRLSRESPGAAAQLREAAVAVLELVEVLGLGSFRGSLAHETKDRFVLRFSGAAHCPLFARDADVVLKVYGDARRGEGPLQALWKYRGVPTPTLMHGVHANCSWLLLEYVRMQSAYDLNFEEKLRLTDGLASFSAIMHKPAPHLRDVLRPLGEVMVPRWLNAATTLRAAEFIIPSEWQELAAAAYAGGGEKQPLHGDLGLKNVALSAGRDLIVFDASALSGPAAFDSARWAARLSPQVSPFTVLQRWWKVDRLTVDDSMMLLAAECVMEAGSQLAVASRMGKANHVKPRVAQILEIAAELW